MIGGIDAQSAFEWIDGNWVDMGSLMVAAIYALIKSLRRADTSGRWGSMVSKATALDFANGTSLFPLVLLGMTALSSKLLAGLLTANKLILSVAGFCALLALLEDDFK